MNGGKGAGKARRWPAQKRFTIVPPCSIRPTQMSRITPFSSNDEEQSGGEVDPAQGDFPVLAAYGRAKL
jgi:hypothetical protein